MITDHRDKKGWDIYHLQAGLASGGYCTLEEFDDMKVL